MKNFFSSLQCDGKTIEWECRVPYLQQSPYTSAEKDLLFFHWRPSFYWYENESHLCLEWDIEGLTPNELKFAVQHRTLVIEKRGIIDHEELGETRKACPDFTQKIRLPKHLQYQKGEASYHSGKLIILFPKLSIS